jgi:hypothetical protein
VPIDTAPAVEQFTSATNTLLRARR